MTLTANSKKHVALNVYQLNNQRVLIVGAYNSLLKKTDHFVERVVLPFL